MAVVDYVDKKRKDPPPELEIGWNMRSFGGLLEAGGVLDQPVALMKRVRTALNVETIWRTYKTLKSGNILDWKRNNPDDWQLIRYIEELKHGDE